MIGPSRFQSEGVFPIDCEVTSTSPMLPGLSALIGRKDNVVVLGTGQRLFLRGTIATAIRVPLDIGFLFHILWEKIPKSSVLSCLLADALI